jgi:hypothetical protein
VVVNGIPDERSLEGKEYANGIGHLTALLIGKLQEEGHDPKLYPEGAACGQEFEYQISADGERLSIQVFDGPMTLFGLGGETCNNLIFDGDLEAFDKFLDGEKGDP